MWSRVLIVLSVVAAAACGQVIDTTIQDASITAAVKTALLNDAAVDATTVSVTTEGGVVKLSGVQPTAEAAAHIVSVVRGVQGVHDVESTIAIGPPPVPEQPD
jgi:hyperosmotically inducible protein